MVCAFAVYWACLGSVATSACCALLCVVAPPLAWLCSQTPESSLESPEEPPSPTGIVASSSRPFLWRHTGTWRRGLRLASLILKACAVFVGLFFALTIRSAGHQLVLVVLVFAALVGHLLLACMSLKRWAAYAHVQGLKATVPQLLLALETTIGSCVSVSYMLTIGPCLYVQKGRWYEGRYPVFSTNSWVDEMHLRSLRDVLESVEDTCNVSAALLIFHFLRNLLQKEKVPRPFILGQRQRLALVLVAVCSASADIVAHLTSVAEWLNTAGDLARRFLRFGIGVAILHAGCTLRRFLVGQELVTIGTEKLFLNRLSWTGFLMLSNFLCNIVFMNRNFIAQQSRWAMAVCVTAEDMVFLIIHLLHILAFIPPAENCIPPAESMASRRCCWRRSGREQSQEPCAAVEGPLSEQVNRGVSLTLARTALRELRAEAAAEPGVMPSRLQDRLAADPDYVADQAERVAFTTADLVHKFVRPRTQQNECPYVQLVAGSVDEHGRPHVGRATCFVSHAWLCEFELLLDVLEESERVAGCSPHYWIDCFAINQHRAGDAGELDQLGPTIAACGRLLIAANPWTAPAPLARAWCLFEVHTAWQEGVQIELHTSSRDKAEFFRQLDNDYEAVERALSSVDAQQASATVEADKIRIFERIESKGGFCKFNAALAGLLRACLYRIVLQRFV